tara:strand:- start:9 stop:344 length:336 start_codon:yes stop_codon:yes gene_type:complete
MTRDQIIEALEEMCKRSQMRANRYADRLDRLDPETVKRVDDLRLVRDLKGVVRISHPESPEGRVMRLQTAVEACHVVDAMVDNLLRRIERSEAAHGLASPSCVACDGTGRQ